MIDKRIYIDDHAKRQAIRSGWDGFQIKGWKAKPPYEQADNRWWFWMNGMEGAEKNYKGHNLRVDDVPGYA